MANASLDPIDILLELGFDLDDISDDESYLSAMKEAIATIEFKTQGKGDDRSTALREEVIKVTRQRRSKRTVDVNKVFKTKPKASTVAGPKLLAASKDYKEQKEEEEKQEKAVTAIIPAGLKRVSDGINDITKVLVRDLTAEKKQADEERKAAENLAAETEEKESEKQSQESAGNFLKGLKPPEIPFFDRIKQFFQNVLVGGLLSWLAKPENKDKVQGFADFIRDHGGKILTGILALVALDVGMKLLGFLKLFTPLVKVMLSAAKFLATKLLSLPGAAVATTLGLLDRAGAAGRDIRGGIAQMLGGGDRQSSRGDKYNFADMQSREQTLNALLASPGDASEEEIKAVEAKRDQYREFQNRMRQTKSLSDQLKDSQARMDRMNAGGLDKGSRAYTDLQQQIKDLETNLEQSLRIEDEMFLGLGIEEGMADRDRIMTEGGILNLFDGEYKQRRSEVEQHESSKPFRRGVTKEESDRAIIDEVLRSQSDASSSDGGLTHEQKKKEVDHLEATPPPITEPTAEDLKPKDTTPEFQQLLKDKPVSPQTEEILKKLFETPPKPMQVSVLPVSVPAQKPQVASSSAGQKTAPTFGSVDPNNTSVPMIAGVYNSPVAV